MKLFLSTILFAFCLSSATALGQNYKWSSPLQKCWTFTLTEPFSGFASDNDFLFTTSPQTITAINTKSDFIWSNKKEDSEIFQVKILNGKILIISKDKTNPSEIIVENISRETGLSIWKKHFELSDKFKAEFIVNSLSNEVFIENSGEIVSLNLETGMMSKIVKIPIQDKNSGILIKHDKIFYHHENSVFIYSFSEKKLINKVKTSLTISRIEVDKENIVILDEIGNIIFIDKNYISWRAKVGAKVIDSYFNKRNLIFSSNDNYLYQVSRKNGKLIWKKRFQNRFSMSYVESSDNLFILLNNEATLFILEAVSGEIINQLLLDKEKIFIGKPLIINDLVILFSQNEVSAYALNQCQK